MAGKPRQAGVKTSLDPQREEFADIQTKLRRGNREWRMIRLRELISVVEKECGGRLADNYLSASAAEIAQERGYVLRAEIDKLWRDIAAEFERSVLDANGDWFDRQAKAIRSGDRRSDTDKARGRFDAAVAKVLEMAFWRTRVEQQKRTRVEQQKCNSALRALSPSDTARKKAADAMSQSRRQWMAVKQWRAEQQKPRALHTEAATLEPAGKQTGITAREVLEQLDVQTFTRPSEIHGKRAAALKPSKRTYIVVEGCLFESKRRACDAITRIAKLHRLELLV